MKKLIILLTILIVLSGFGYTQAVSLRLTEYNNDGTNYDVLVEITASAAMDLGSSNLRFNFNASALSNPTVHKVYDYDVSSSLAYAALTVTEPVGGIASVNIWLTSVGNGNPVTVSPTWTWICVVRFALNNPLATTQFVWRSMSASPNPTIVFLDDESTLATQGTFAGLDVPLPVELAEFTAEVGLSGVDLYWRTESEIENIGFQLEKRLADAEDWDLVVNYKTDGTLMGQGTVPYPTEYEYVDKLVENGEEYEYRLADIDYEGVVTYHATRFVTVNNFVAKTAPEKFTLYTAYPNPFNPYANIRFDMPEQALVKINIYNQLGQLVRSLQNGMMQPGAHSIRWDAKDNTGQPLGAGVYLYHIEAGSFSKTQKLIYLK